MAQAKKKKTKKKAASKRRKSRSKTVFETYVTSDQKKLFDRILIGLGVDDEVVETEGFVPVYILNPSARGMRKKVAGNSSTWPAFGLMGAHNDEMLQSKLEIDHDEVELVPFWMRRFVAATREGFLIGYTFCPVDRSSFAIATIEVDYALAAKMFGPSPTNMQRDLRIEEVAYALKSCAEALESAAGIPFTMQHVALLDVGPEAFQSKGGNA
jgi:hypothetical protein